jgi:hypothetical protein
LAMTIPLKYPSSIHQSPYLPTLFENFPSYPLYIPRFSTCWGCPRYGGFPQIGVITPNHPKLVHLIVLKPMVFIQNRFISALKPMVFIQNQFISALKPMVLGYHHLAVCQNLVPL